MKNIGIYDSGCGGFSVINQLLSQGYSGNIFYYGDTINNPWGNKTKLELKIILETITAWFNQHNVDAVFSGCNTTLSIFGEELPTLLNNPLYNILENTEESYTESNYSVLSTENSTKTHLFSRFLPNKTIQEIPCPNLANLIEKNQWDAAIADAISIIKNAQYPTIILGCTHYPLILKELQEHMPHNTFINPASFLKIPTALMQPFENQMIHFKTTGNEDTFHAILKASTNINKYTLNSKLHENTSHVKSLNVTH